jgi:hypothetical protein
MKQIYLFFALFILVITSCTTVEFATSQPDGAEELSEFPANMRGKYIVPGHKKDTLCITESTIQYGKYGENTRDSLDQVKTILKKSNDYFILNFKNKDNYWDVNPIKIKGNKIIMYTIMLDTSNQEAIVNKIRAITKVTELKDSLGNLENYLVNPTKDEFQQLLDKEIFSFNIVLKKIK